jgi:hypothetical protein
LVCRDARVGRHFDTHRGGVSMVLTLRKLIEYRTASPLTKNEFVVVFCIQVSKMFSSSSDDTVHDLALHIMSSTKANHDRDCLENIVCKRSAEIK